MDDGAPLLSVEAMAEWYCLPRVVIDRAAKLLGPAYAVRQKVAGVYTAVPVGVYWHAVAPRAAICDEHGAAQGDLARVKAAVARVREPEVIDAEAAAGGDWVKVAYSPFLRRVGELLNFFPGRYPGGIPNLHGPVASMLTSGLVGAGLGYGAGWLGEKLLPENWQRDRLRYTLAGLGGAAGVLPGLLYGISNVRRGLPFTDNSLLNYPPGAPPDLSFRPQEKPGFDAMNAMAEPAERLTAALPLGQDYKLACAGAAEAMDADTAALLKEAWGEDDGRRPPLPAVNIDAMGRTLWESGSDPATAGAAMGALAAAGQMPGGIGPGWVTPQQMGQLAANMGAGYISGALVGGALGLLAGMPMPAQDTLKRTGMYLGIVKAVLPRLFDR